MGERHLHELLVRKAAQSLDTWEECPSLALPSFIENSGIADRRVSVSLRNAIMSVKPETLLGVSESNHLSAGWCGW